MIRTEQITINDIPVRVGLVPSGGLEYMASVGGCDYTLFNYEGKWLVEEAWGKPHRKVEHTIGHTGDVDALEFFGKLIIGAKVIAEIE